MYLRQTVIFPLIFSLAEVSNSAPENKMESVVEPVAAQNALFDEQYESDLREFPERATDFDDSAK
jgi:hypothetical protein